MTFATGMFQFIDSNMFLSNSLENLVISLSNSGKTTEPFHNIKKLLETYNLQDSEEATNLITSKGIYPYQCTGQQLPNLPPIEDFYNDLTKENCSKKDYERAQLVYKTFNCQSFQDYHDLYLKTDVALLADVFENFINLGINYYGLDPSHYISLPSYANDCLYKMTETKMQLLDKEDDYEFYESSIRGGISMIARRHAKANNKYMSNYDKSKDSTFLTYLDANNLYGWAMMQCLPVGDFRWLETEEIDILSSNNFEALKAIKSDGDKGYYLEVDIEFPEHLHDYFDDYPLCPESEIVTEDMVSDYGKDLLRRLDGKHDKTKKLILSLKAKKNYKCHYRYIQFCLEQGMVITKIHRVHEFTQKSWMADYINFNTNKRSQEGISDVEKDFFKLMNNAVFGKSMEDIRRRFDFKFVTDEEKANKLTKSPLFKDTHEFHKDLVGVSMLKKNVKLNKPIFTGACILDLSKLLMADFHYNTIKKRYPGKQSQLLFTDTDSLAYILETEDLYEDMKEDEDLYDLSEFPKNHPLFCNKNKKVVGKFKDEMAGKIVYEFIGLRAKMYSFLFENHDFRAESNQKQVCKGIKKSVIKQKLKHDNYLNTLLKEEQLHADITSLRSYGHTINTIDQRKVALSPYDNKKFRLDPIFSRSYGHCLNATNQDAIITPNYVESISRDRKFGTTWEHRHCAAINLLNIKHQFPTCARC